MSEESDLIFKDALIGFLAVKSTKLDGSEYVWVKPLSYSWEIFNDEDSDLESDVPIGLLSAPPKSYVVYGVFPDGDKPYPENGEWKQLGYEFEGAYHPNWLETLKERVKLNE